MRKRTELADLRGRVALLTGGRVKIGYQAGIKLLRAGAQLIVTTRFPRDSAVRYAAEPDFKEWGHRLEIFGLDLRHTPSVEAFCRHLVPKYSRLDFIINNACQTVRRPPDFYEHMMERENGSLHELPAESAEAARRIRRSARLPHVAGGGRRARAKAHVRKSPGSLTPRNFPRSRCCRRSSPRSKRSFHEGARSGFAAGRSARAQLVAAHAVRGALG
ncbi:MAG: SDR family oxidoreductase [Verrucomicrobia bacterium]|nr:SDR family oxidoreductase [Verrucomicrobiota bacterium]